MSKGKQHAVTLNNDFHKFEVGQEVAFDPLGGFLCRVDKIIPLNVKGQCKIIVTRLDEEEAVETTEGVEEEIEIEIEEEEDRDEKTEDSDA